MNTQEFIALTVIMLIMTGCMHGKSQDPILAHECSQVDGTSKFIKPIDNTQNNTNIVTTEDLEMREQELAILLDEIQSAREDVIKLHKRLQKRDIKDSHTKKGENCFITSIYDEYEKERQRLEALLLMIMEEMKMLEIALGGQFKGVGSKNSSKAPVKTGQE